MSSHFDRNNLILFIGVYYRAFLTLLQLFEEDWPRIMSSLDKAISQKPQSQIGADGPQDKVGTANFLCYRCRGGSTGD